MEGAGKMIEDEELRAAMAEKGLGTPATRAAIIEGLIMDQYVVRQGKELIVSSKGRSLIQLLRGIGIDALCSADLTGDWEYKLKQIEQGKLDRHTFMHEIRGMTEQIVQKAKTFEGDSVEGSFVDLEAVCPKCEHAGLKEDYRTYTCPQCEWRVWKTMAGREFAREEMATLLAERKIGPIEGFRSKMGRPFAAIVILNEEDLKPGFDFGPKAEGDGETLDLTTMTPLATSAIGNIYEVGNSYICEKPDGSRFRMGKTILQREIPVDQVVKMLENGKTDLLPKFISKKGRPFSAYLKLEGGKVGFEFEPRKAAAPKGKKKPSPPRAEAA